MSRKLLAFLLSELKTVRIICHNPKCEVVTEVALDRMKLLCTKPKCPACNADLLEANSIKDNLLTRFAESLHELQKHKDKFDLEFILPDSAPDAPGR